MRRLSMSLLAFACLLAAAPPKASPTPSPRPTPKATRKPAGPKVLLYPFQVTASGLPKDAGSTVALIFSRAFEASGGLDVLPTPPPTVQKQYPATAAHLGAAYYIAGYITPIGQGVSILEQVVSVTNGIIIYSKTAQVFGVNDAAALALNARSAILADAGIGTDYSTSSGSATPAPTHSGPAGEAASVKISGISAVLGHLFGKHPVVAAAPSVSKPKPTRRALIIRVQGAIPGGELTTSTDILSADLAKHFNAAIVGAPPGQLTDTASAICGDNRDTTILTGRIEQHPGHFGGRGSTTFYLRAYACFGSLLYHRHASATTIPAAIAEAVEEYVSAHPGNE